MLPPSQPSTNSVDVVRGLFLNPTHRAYQEGGSPSLIGPESVFHIGQVEVLLEQQQYHWRTNAALKQLRANGFLRERTVVVHGAPVTLVWRHNVRYVERAISQHRSLLEQYASPALSKATGDYAETLTLLGLSRLGLRLVTREARSYGDRTWTKTGHDLDFILEGRDAAYGVEVKNTFDYMPNDEIEAKLDLCDFLGLLPLFVVQVRHSRQWELVKNRGGMLYMFKSKIFPPGHEDLVRSVWSRMRLPVAVWNDWPRTFYQTLGSFTQTLDNLSL